MLGQGIHSVDQGLHQRKLVVLQGSSDTDHSLELGKKKLLHLHETGCWTCDPWLTLLADSKSYQMWLPDIC